MARSRCSFRSLFAAISSRFLSSSSLSSSSSSSLESPNSPLSTVSSSSLTSLTSSSSSSSTTTASSTFLSTPIEFPIRSNPILHAFNRTHTFSAMDSACFIFTPKTRELFSRKMSSPMVSSNRNTRASNEDDDQSSKSSSPLVFFFFASSFTSSFRSDASKEGILLEDMMPLKSTPLFARPRRRTIMV